MTSPDERDLRDRFQALRQSERVMSPGFRLPSRAARRPSATLRLARVGAVLAVAAGVWWVARTRVSLAPRYAVDLSATRWQSPTDFLLETPGIGYLRAVPRLAPTTNSPDDPTGGALNRPWRIPL